MKKNNLGMLLSGVGILAVVIYMIMKDKKWYFYLFALPVSGALYGIGYALGKDEEKKEEGGGGFVYRADGSIVKPKMAVGRAEEEETKPRG